MNGRERENGRVPLVPYAQISDLGVSDVHTTNHEMGEGRGAKKNEQVSEDITN